MNIQSLTTTISQPSQTIVFLKGDDNNEQQEEQKMNQQIEEKKKKKPTRKIQWQEDTIDNEHLGRLKSNLCCIYHKPKDATNPSSGTCTSDDDGNELDRDRITKKRHKKKCSKHVPIEDDKQNQSNPNNNNGDQNNHSHSHNHHHNCHGHNH